MASHTCQVVCRESGKSRTGRQVASDACVLTKNSFGVLVADGILSDCQVDRLVRKHVALIMVSFIIIKFISYYVTEKRRCILSTIQLLRFTVAAQDVPLLQLGTSGFCVALMSSRNRHFRAH